MSTRIILCPISNTEFEHTGRGRPRVYSPNVTLAQIARYRRQLKANAKAAAPMAV